MRRLARFPIRESGFDVTATYTACTVERVLSVLAKEIAEGFARGETRGGGNSGRYLVGLAGPPGCGKSTLSAVLRETLEGMGIPAIVLPLDGFHLTNDELGKRTTRVGDNLVPLADRKGSKESYDFAKLLFFMERLGRPGSFYWPLYSRILHEPVEEGVLIPVHPYVCLIEGNYLFLRSDPWGSLGRFFHKRIFILSGRRVMRRRILARKTKGGFSRRAAKAHFRRSDALNIDEVIRDSAGWDRLLVGKGRFGYRLL